MKPCVKYLLSCLGVLSLSLSPLSAATFFVDRNAPGPSHDGAAWATAFPTVVQGLAAAGDGDEVWVAAGVYVENVTLPAGVALYGGFVGTETARAERDPNAHLTVLDGNDAGTVVTVAAAAPEATILDGFTIRNGDPDGIHCLEGSSPVIRNNTVSDCTKSGVACVSGAVHVEGNAITRNGSGILVTGGGVTVRNNSIRRSEGTGIFVAGSPGDEPCEISGNLIADSRGYGIVSQTTPLRVVGNRIERQEIGIRLGRNYIVDPKVQHRVIANHIRGSRDCGLDVYFTSDTTVVGNVIAGGARAIVSQSGGSNLIANNTIGGHVGDAMTLRNVADKPGSYEVINNIIAFNQHAVYVEPGVSVVHRRNAYYSNGAPTPQDTRYLQPTEHDLTSDPLLADLTHGDLHILPGSPGRDAGESLPILADLLDMDGQPRVQGASVDIGADESDGSVPEAPVTSVVHVHLNGDDGADGATWATAKRTVQAAIDASTFGEVWIAGGTYQERITLPPLVHLYGGFAGNETQRDRARPHWTVLDGMKGGSVLTVLTGNLVNIVDGLTITNGSATRGGGVLANGGVILENCVIRSNTAQSGGGICVQAGTPRIRGNTIEANSASMLGSGVSLPMGTGSGTLERNIIRWNSGTGSVAAVHSDGPRMALRSNVIAGNEGRGVYTRGDLELINNTVVGNSDGGVQTSWGSHTAVNNIIAFNTGPIGYSFGGPMPAFGNNCLFGNTGGQFPAPESGTGNIVADPLFVNRAGDQHLRDGSPCVDAGDNAFVGANDRDVDGQPRSIGGRVDIGADETPFDSILLSEVPLVLRAAGGLSAATAEDVARWDVTGAGSSDAVTLHDAYQLARRALGLE